MCPPVKAQAKSHSKKLELFHSWAGSEQVPVDEMVGAFEKKNPGIKISSNVLDWVTYMSVVKARMSENNPPDILSTEAGQRLMKYAKGGQLADLADVWEEQKLSSVFPEWVKASCILDGKIYGVPSKEYTFVVWYLTKVFKQYDVEPPKTWEELLEACKTFKESGMAPVIAGASGTFVWFMHILVNTVGVEFYNKLMAGKARWTDPKVIDAYEILRDFSKEYFYPHPFGYNFRLAWAKLNKYEAAMQLEGDWINGMWQREFKYKPGKDYDFFLLPPINPKMGQVMAVGGNAWAMPEKSKHHGEVKAFMKYASSVEAHEIMAKHGMGIMTNKGVPKEVYDPLSVRIRDSCTKHQAVLEMGCAFPQKLIEAEEFYRMRIILDPTLNRDEIKDMAAEMEMRAKEYFGLERLHTLGQE